MSSVPNVGVFFRCALALVLLEEVLASVSRHHALRGNSSRTLARHRNVLPDVCKHCEAGLANFFDETAYCNDMKVSCSCCRNAIAVARLQICSQSQFMGYGTCLSGISHAITVKEQQCAQARAARDLHHQQELQDAMGAAREALTGSFFASQRQFVLRRFEDVCAETCSTTATILCEYDSGCDYQLQDEEAAFLDIKHQYDLYHVMPCA
mmetsp:Transcript_48441/g.128305  ORF Transcript_48441/g.128305 Transcript_48441/m.128305 type:complete len:209 (-) Transcript_48441:173-799(-)